MKFKTKKKYGQNFIDDQNLLSKIIEESNISKDDKVIEIGPGLGSMTKKLLESSSKVIAFEIDDELIPLLENKFRNNNNFLLIHDDFLDVDLDKYITKENEFNVVANIPYYITSPIIRKIINYRKGIKSIVLMVQKEVAERICAKPKTKNMSILTHSIQFFGETEYLFTVDKALFDPVPKVDSAIIKINLFKDERYEKLIEEQDYFDFIKTAFENKRKNLSNNLLRLDYSKEDVKNKLIALGHSEFARAEELSIDDFIKLRNSLKKVISNNG